MFQVGVLSCFHITRKILCDWKKKRVTVRESLLFQILLHI